MDAMGIINLNESDELLHEMTAHRPLAAVPYGGRYRLIDFVLSNMVNSGINNVGILFQHKYRSLMDHLRSGKEWDLARKRDGLVILPPAYANSSRQIFQRGDVENFHANLDYIAYSRQKYVVIASSHVVCNIDFKHAINFHEESGADITIIYGQNCDSFDMHNGTLLRVQADGVVGDIKVGAGTQAIDDSTKLSLDMYVIERKKLIDLIRDCMSHDGYDFIKHCLIRNIGKLKICGYGHDGYLARIVSMHSYFKHSMDLLNPDVWQELFFGNGFIYTKVKDEPPSKYTEQAKVYNSLVAGGCYIEGTVENSIIFRGVTVAKGAHIKDSILMQKTEIGPNTYLDNVICDKNVRIASDRKLKGESAYPLVVKKGREI